MFKKINKRLFLIVLASVFVGIVVGLVGYQGVSATSDTDFCKSCHDAPQVLEHYEASPHANVDCIDCHTKGFIKDKTDGIRKAFITYTGMREPNDYTQIDAQVKDETCYSCHNFDHTNRDERVIEAHEIYSENELGCTDCHDGVEMHGVLRDYSNEH